jgi:ABC-2 type transport system permease protein
MRKLWVVVKREYMERVRTKWFAIATVFGPILFGSLMILPAYFTNKGKASQDIARIRILDVTGTELGKLIGNELNGGAMGDSSLTQVQSTASGELAAAESLATRDVIAKRLKGYLVLSRKPLVGITARYSGTNATAMADMRRIESVTSSELLALQLRSAGINAADAERMTKTVIDLKTERITPSGRGGSGSVSLIFALAVAMLLYMTILIYGQNVLRGVIEEKQTRVAEVVVSSISTTTLLAGKVLGVGAVGLTQMVIWLATSWGMFKFREPILRRFGTETPAFQLPHIDASMVVLLVIFFVLGYTLYAALFAAVGAMVSTEQEAQQAQLPVVLLLVMSVIFLQPVLNEPDGKLAATLAWIPFSSPIVMPLRLSAVSVPAWEIAVSLLALAAGCYVSVYVAARIYRTGLLMYGKRPTLRELVRWVKRPN